MATILVVEDDASCRDLLVRTLQRGGHESVTAANGWEALLALDASEIDLILLDLMMPGMDGRTFMRILRNDRRWRNLPVILLSALSFGDLFNGAVQLGVSDCLQKTKYTPMQLLDSVRHNLGNRITTHLHEQARDQRMSDSN